MKLSIVTGTAGCGKTSAIFQSCKHLISMGNKPAVVKIDCIATEDDLFYRTNGIPSIKALAKDLCPDHFTTYNLEDILEWSNKQDLDILIIETAGYCLRCSPYTKDCLGIFVADVTQGMAMPLKVGPMLSLADVVVVIKGDIVSQAEREVFTQRVESVNPRAKIIEVNGLTGYGCRDIAEIISKNQDVSKEHILRERAPFAVCTLCTGEIRANKEFHRGLLRNIQGIEVYKGE